MKNVNRISEPDILRRNAARWKQELLQEIHRAKQQGEKPDSKFYDRYNHPEVKAALGQMYKRLCCYCEAPVKVVTKGHIEHRKPKKGKNAFPEETFDWDNLHLACPECNAHKGDKWSKDHEILDAVADLPISNHLTYEIEEIGVFRVPLTPRGTTTIDHADLNRDDLSLDVRIKVLLSTLNVIKQIKELGQDPRVTSKKALLKSKTKGEYGSLVGYAIKNFLDTNYH